MNRRYGSWVGLVWFGVVALALCGSSCGAEEKAVNRVGVNVVEKALFQDSWYMARTVVDVDYQGSALGTFPGDAASDRAQNFTALPRIRWVIDEKFLLAYRDYQLTEGGDGQSKGPPATTPKGQTPPADPKLGEPVAAFAIQKHFDIKRDYNAATGEQQNVITENDKDRRWYEREFMRVDWSKNLLPGYYGQTYNLYELLGNFEREPADLLVQDQSAFPASWRPRFDRMQCDGSGDKSAQCTDQEREFADDYAKDTLYHMSFVTQETLSPGDVPDPDDASKMINWCTAKRYSDAPTCSAVASYVRTSFLRKSDKREYEPVNWTDSRFERFGYFRLEQPTIDRSTGKPDDPAFFATDFLNYNVNRHNIWKKWFDAKGEPLPYTQRDIRHVVWYTTPELPAHLMRSSLDVVAQWNTILMETVRELRGQAQPSYPAEVPCQTADPDAYCFCQQDASTGLPIRPTCPGRYDPFQSPEDAKAAGVGDPYQCWVKAPAGAEPDLDKPGLSDSDFNKWFSAKFEGPECINILRANTCNRAAVAAHKAGDPELACEERGDLRYKFISYVDQPGTGFLGVATLRGDPETGEILTGDANIGGPALDSYRTTALQTYDLVKGNISEEDIVDGEDVRSYFENVGRIDQPARPRSGYNVASPASALSPTTAARTREEIDNRMQVAMKRLDRLKGPEGRKNVMSDRMQKLVGTDIERRLVAGSETLLAAGYDPNTPLTEEVLDRASPFRGAVDKQLTEARQIQDKLSRANVEMPNEYVDNSVSWFVNKHQDWSRARLEFTINRLLFRQTELHELGHCMGLRHDFGGTADSDHYSPEYYDIIAKYPSPDPASFDLDGTQSMSPEEQVEFNRAEQKVRADRELAGIDGAMSSSVMDYTSNWYERLQPLGRYDRAAIAFGYGDLVEAYDKPTQAATPSPNGRRSLFTSYQGGESCTTDADCPYSENGSRAGLLRQRNLDTGIVQSCVANNNPRASAQTNAAAKVCSNFDTDLASLAVPYAPLNYRFCTDERADATLAWCNRFDEGASYRDIVRNVTEDYERMYPFSAFRRYRKTFGVGSYRDAFAGRRLVVLQNIYQNLLFEYTSNPAFRQRDGNLGFYDQFLATTDILNFYGRVLAQPDIGNYAFNPQTGTFADAAQGQQTDLPVPFGLGRYYYSDYQAGLSGIERIERVGNFIDKVLVLQAMTARGEQPDYTRDVAFYANFYDLFPNEMQQIFNGMIRAYPKSFMPRVICDGADTPCSNARLMYLDFYRGDCSKQETCAPSPEVTYAKYPVLDGGGSLSLQLYAALYGLQNFPVYFDTQFQNQLFICIEGQGDCVQPPTTAVEGTDYVRYTSPHYRRSFLAFQVKPSEGVAEQTSIGFDMVKEARDLNSLQGILTRLRALGTPFAIAGLPDADRAQLTALGYVPPTSAKGIDSEIDRIESRLQSSESFFNQIIQFERELGIQGFQAWQ